MRRQRFFAVILVGKSILLREGLAESYVQQIFVSWLLSHARMNCPQANPKHTLRCFSLSIPAMILIPHSNKSNFSETAIRTHALWSLPITIG